MWLKSNFTKTETEGSQIVGFNEKSSSTEFIFQLKKSIIKRIKGVELNFDPSFDKKINTHISAEENFKNFSNQALKIWNNDFTSNDFKKYCDYLKLNFPRQLYHRQLLSSYHLSFSQNAANFSVPGSGKTSIVYAAYCYLNGLEINNSKYVNKIIVIGPHSSFTPWEEQYEEIYSKKIKSYRLNGENPKNERISFLSNFLNNDVELILITYESVPILINYLIPFCQFSQNKIMLVCDEAHKIKNLEGTRAASVLELANHVCSRVVLTGTPCPNGPEDLYNLFKFLYPKRNILKFKPSALSSFNEPGNYNKLTQLIENIKPFFLRITKKDLCLPKVTTDKIINAKLSGLEKRVYNKILKSMESSRSDISKVSLHYRLIQAALNIHLLKNKTPINEYSNLYDEDPNFSLRKVLGEELFSLIENLDEGFVPAKHKEVLSKAIDLKKQSQKVIIWGVYIDSIKRLHKLLHLHGLKGEVIIGETKKGETEDYNQDEITRAKIIKQFKSFSKESFDYIITNPVVLGESVSLHRQCNNSIYFEMSYAAAPYVQSRDRIHRVWIENGRQKNYETHYYHIISSGENRNIDEMVFSRVQRKWKEMEKIIEHDIPLFSENIQSTIKSVITEVINEYRKK